MYFYTIFFTYLELNMKNLILSLLVILYSVSSAEVIKVGSGSYTTKTPKFINGTRDLENPKMNRPMNVDGPCFSNNVPENAWKPIYPAVTERFRASGKRVTTNQFWSSIIFKFNGGSHSNRMYPGPLSVNCNRDGIYLNNQRTIFVNNRIPSGDYTTANMKVDISPVTPLKIGILSVDADSTLVDDYGDWHVKAAWKKDSIIMSATFGRGSPFVYFEDIKQKIKISSNDPNTRLSSWYKKENDKLTLGIKNESTKEYWLLFLPADATYVLNNMQPGPEDTVFFKEIIVDLKSKDYFSIASVFNYDVSESTVQLMKKYAFSFIKDTKVSWNFDEKTGLVTSKFDFITLPKQGTENNTIVCLFPHQYNNIDGQVTFSDLKYPVIKGWMKSIEAKSFTTKLKPGGILYHFPKLINKTRGDTLKQFLDDLNKVKFIELIPDYNTSYGHGKSTLRVLSAIQAARAVGDTTKAKVWKDRVKMIFENWMSTSATEVDDAKPSGLISVQKRGGGDTLVPDTTSIGNYLLFYYNKTWNSIYGLPAGFNTDNEFNDHHFTWGYFIRALIEIMESEGKDYGSDDKWGGMIKMLIRDIAGDYRKVSDGGLSDTGDPLFPRFRNWDPYMGYGLASGHASFDDGNNQESTSEAMNFITSLALFGAMNGDKYYRDLGLYMYATQLSSIENYWFDVHKKNFWREPREWNKVDGKYVKELDSASYIWPFISIAWDSKSEMTNFFRPSIESLLGIQLLPYTPSSLYLARYSEWYADVYNNAYQKLVKFKDKKPVDHWQNIIWQFISLYHSQEAIDEFNNFRNFTRDDIIEQENVASGNYGENGTTRSYTYYWLHTLDSLGRLDTAITTVSTPFYSIFINQKLHKRTYIAFNPDTSSLNVTFSDGEKLDVPPFSTAYLNKAAKISLENFKPVLKSSSTEIDFDTLDVGDSRKRMYVYTNTTDTLQVIDDIEIADQNDKEFYLSYLDDERFILPGHNYVGMVGFKPKKPGLATETLVLLIDSAAGTTPPFSIILKGFARGSVDVEDETQLLNITAAPNPASDRIELFFNHGSIAEGSEVSISDMNGNIILKEILKIGTEKYILPLNNFSSGTYILSLVTNVKIYHAKIIVVK